MGKRRKSRSRGGRGEDADIVKLLHEVLVADMMLPDDPERLDSLLRQYGDKELSDDELSAVIEASKGGDPALNTELMKRMAKKIQQKIATTKP